jgi:hypothetical protein
VKRKRKRKESVDRERKARGAVLEAEKTAIDLGGRICLLFDTPGVSLRERGRTLLGVRKKTVKL